MISWVLHHMLFDRDTIGSDERYLVFVICMPIVLGLIFLSLYRKDMLIALITIKEGAGIKFISLGFILLQGIFVSFMSFGFLGNALWNQLNIREAKSNTPYNIECEIEQIKISKGSNARHKIYFYHNDKFESLDVSYSDVEQYENKDMSNYVINVRISEGIWGYSIIEGWRIKKRPLIFEP